MILLRTKQQNSNRHSQAPWPVTLTRMTMAESPTQSLPRPSPAQSQTRSPTESVTVRVTRIPQAGTEHCVTAALARTGTTTVALPWPRMPLLQKRGPASPARPRNAEDDVHV
jgi:hypothetical protein